MKPNDSNKRGQAITEYIVMIAVALSVVAILSMGLRHILFKLWAQMACEITAACPSCPPSIEVKNIANQLAPGSCK